MIRLQTALTTAKASSLLKKIFPCMLLLVPLAAMAQNADLSGRVLDPNHALVAGASIDVTQDATGVVQQTTTNGQGAYFLSLQPGSYSMDVAAPGFATIHRENIILQVAQPARLDFVLKIGRKEQTVTVVAGTEGLQESISVGTTITDEEIARLPVDGVDGRNYTSLIVLTPGTSDISVSGGDGTISGTTLYSVNGQRTQDNHFTLDGVDNNFLHKQSPGISPPMDAIKEFRVATNNSAEYGRSAGGNIALITKSGGNKLHGAVYEYSRQALLDANMWFNDHTGVAKQPYHYNQFGFILGGPAALSRFYHGRDKTFWFFAYDGFRLRSSNPIFSNVPTLAERGGDFSTLKQTIYDPLTSVQNPGTGAITRTAFFNNKILSNRLDSAALAYLNDFVPLPNSSSLPGNANYANYTPTRNNRNLYIARIDHHINARNSVFFRIFHQGATQETPQALPTYTETTSLSGLNYAAGWDFIMNTANLLQVRFGFNNPEGPDVTRNTLGITRSQFFSASGIQIFSPFSPYNVLPTINATDFSLSETGGTSVDDIYELDSTYTKTMGPALLKFGFTFQPRHYYHDATSPTSGTATFAVTQTNATALSSDTKTGSGTASFLLGFPTSIDRGQGSADVDATQKFYAAFVTYNRKLGGRLTADLGLRYEFYLPPADKQDRLGTIWIHNDPVSGSLTGTLLWAGVNPLPDPTTGVVNQPPNRAGFGRGLAQTNVWNLMPRVGLAYLLNQHTIVRAGYGIYDNTTDYQEVQDERKFYPYNFEQTFATNSGVLPDTTLESSGPAFNSVINLGGYAQDPAKKTPYSQQYNLTVEHEFPGGVIGQIAYVGATNKHLVGYEPFNTAPLPDPNPADIATLNSRRVLPQYGDFYQGANRYISNYNALQVLAARRYRRGFKFQANYTYSRSLDNQSSLGEMKTQDPFNLRASYSRSSFDLTHIFNASFVYDLPFGRGRRFGGRWPRTLDAFAGGWSLESINRYETGPPVNVTLGGLDIANTGYAGVSLQRPNVSGDPNAGPKSIAHWFNTAAFSAPAFGTYGNSAPFTIHSDAIRRADLAVYKRFITVNKQTLDLRGEFFNLPNTPSFGSPKVNFESSGSFGTVTKVAVNARQVQLALRYTF